MSFIQYFLHGFHPLLLLTQAIFQVGIYKHKGRILELESDRNRAFGPYAVRLEMRAAYLTNQVFHLSFNKYCNERT